jgi:hypothetical protein
LLAAVVQVFMRNPRSLLDVVKVAFGGPGGLLIETGTASCEDRFLELDTLEGVWSAAVVHRHRGFAIAARAEGTNGG